MKERTKKRKSKKERKKLTVCVMVLRGTDLHAVMNRLEEHHVIRLGDARHTGHAVAAAAAAAACERDET